MPNAPGFVNIAVPARLRDRLQAHRVVHRQSMHQVIAWALEEWERNNHLVGRSSVRVGAHGADLVMRRDD